MFCFIVFDCWFTIPDLDLWIIVLVLFTVCCFGVWFCFMFPMFICVCECVYFVFVDFLAGLLVVCYVCCCFDSCECLFWIWI